MSGEFRRRRLQEIHGIVESLRAPVDAPDLTGAILDRVHQARPFLAPRTRRWVWPARIGTVAAALLAVLSIVLVQRHSPETTTWGGRSQVLSQVVDCVECEAVKLGKVQEFRGTFTALTERSGVLRLFEVEKAEGAMPAARVLVLAEPVERSEPAASPVRTPPAPQLQWVATGGVRPGLLFADTGPDRLDYRFDGAIGTPVSWSAPPPPRLQRNLLRELGPLLTGQPAGEGLSPR